jgi:hypothetical protein
MAIFHQLTFAELSLEEMRMLAEREAGR